MINLVLAWGVAALFVAAFIIVLRMYLNVRPVGVGLTALAVKEFHEACDSMLKTPKDIPEEVLEAIRGMGRSAFSRGAHWRLRDAIRRDRIGEMSSNPNAELVKAVEEMRPELQALFRKASASWLNVVCNRSLLGNFFISLELRKLQIQKGKTNSGFQEREAVRVMGAVGSCVP